MNLFEMFNEDKELTLIDALQDFLPLVVNHLQLSTLPKIKLKREVEGKHLPTFGSFNNEDSTIELNIANRHPNDILRTLAHELVHHKQNTLDQLDSNSWKTGSDAENEANAEAGVIMRKFNQAHPRYLKLKPIMFESKLAMPAIVAALATALAMPAQAETNAAGQALSIYRKINALKGYGQEGFAAEGEQELRNILHSIQGHPNQSKILPIIKNIIKSPDEEELPPMTIDEAHDEPEDQPGMQSTPSDPIPFPAGTTLVNVSDVYDWYKLGMAVSDLDDADPRTFNKGVPHTVFAFGSEEEEHKMMPLLKRLGFSLHDIDNPQDYAKAIRADEAIAFLETYANENS